MNDSFKLRLDAIQPTQLYINAAKLAYLEAKYPPGTEDRIDPVPVTEMHGKFVYGVVFAAIGSLIGSGGIITPIMHYIGVTAPALA